MNKPFESNIKPLYQGFDNQIDSLIVKDQTDDLELYLKGSTPLKYSTENKNAFIKKPTIPFPEVLSDFIKQSTVKCRIGSLPAINHIWLSTGTSLYLWNGSNNDKDIFRYDSNELIENVDIITLPTHNELLISTQKYIFLHAIDSSNGKKLKLLSKTTVYANDVIMSNAITTNTGRVFLKGHDGHLYELLIRPDANTNYSSQVRIVCHTANRLLSYLPSIFKSTPTEAVKSIVLDDSIKFLFLLMTDSSLRAVNIQGDQYLPLYRYDGKDLESIHLVSSCQDGPRLMALSKNGDAHYFVFREPEILLDYSRSSAPIAGSLLFNSLSQQSIESSFYHQGVVGAILCKSEKKYLLFTSSSIIESSNAEYTIVKDVYQEEIHKKVWSIFENNKSACDQHFKSTLKSINYVTNPVSIVTDAGITHYVNQRPMDYLEDALYSDSSDSLIQFLNRYGSVETTYLAYSLACFSQRPDQAVEFIRHSLAKDDALLLYFTRLVSDIWNVDIKQSSLPRDKFLSVQKDLQLLLSTIRNSHISIKSELYDLINITVEVISFIGCMHHLNWNYIVEALHSVWPAKLTLADFVTTPAGSDVAQNITFIAIESTASTQRPDNYCFIGDYIYNHCSSFFGKTITTYFKGVECLQAGKSNEKAFLESFNHFKDIVSALDLSRLDEISKKYYDIKYPDSAIELIYTKYVSGTTSLSDIHDLLFSIIEKSIEDLTTEGGRQVIMNALSLSDEESYQFEIYRWLLNKEHRQLLISLDSPSLIGFIETQMKTKAESLSCLEAYYSYRNEYDISVDYLYQLATEVEGIPLMERIGYLRKAVDHLPSTKHLDNTTSEQIKRSYMVSEIQQEIYHVLLEINSPEASQSVTQLNSILYSENDLLHQFVYTHSLYEEALVLLNLMDIYNWTYVKTAWTYIIKKCSNETELKYKIKTLAGKLYPSIASFPVYIIYQILHKEKSKEFARSTLIEAGIPDVVIADAEKSL